MLDNADKVSLSTQKLLGYQQKHYRHLTSPPRKRFNPSSRAVLAVFLRYPQFEFIEAQPLMRRDR